MGYSLFIKFLKEYSPIGFKEINRDDSLILELEKMVENNNQFFYIADALQLKILFTSNQSTKFIGIEPLNLTPCDFIEATHPDDLQRLSLGRNKILNMSQEFFIAEKGKALFSTSLRLRNPSGEYSNILVQSYLFYSSIPYKTVFFLKIHTNIDGFKRIKHGYHFYCGNDMTYFRYPDQKMLNIGNVFTSREFEIIKLVALGFSSLQIAEKLYLSPYTISTHRSNILKKANKTQLPELIYDLYERGLL